MKPGDVAIVHPASGQGCPCEHCSHDWHEGLYVDGHRERAGICAMLHELIGTKAGYVSHYCPIPAEVGGEIYRPGRVEWKPHVFVPYVKNTSGPGEAPAPVKGAVDGSRETIPMSPRQGGLCIDPVNAHRERIITLKGGEATSSSCLDPPRARRPNPSGGWFE